MAAIVVRVICPRDTPMVENIETLWYELPVTVKVGAPLELILKSTVRLGKEGKAMEIAAIPIAPIIMNVAPSKMRFLGGNPQT